jgi:hypothetical protein
MARRTKAQIQEEVAQRAEAREKAYFEAQGKAKAGAAEIRPDLPAPDAYTYSYAWKQDPGAPTGEYTLIKNPNPYYDASTNTILNPATGERTPATQSMFSGPTTFRAGGAVVADPNAKDPVTGLTAAQKEAADALANAKGNAATLAAALGAKIDPNTGKIIPSTIDPAKAATWYASQNPSANTSNKTVKSRVTNSDGSVTITYTDGTTSTIPASYSGNKTSGDSTASTDALVAFNKAQAEAATTAARESAFALLKLEFDKYGLGSLVDTVKKYIMAGSPVEEVTLKLRETPEYQARFAGNQLRLKAGLNVYDEATYLQLENAYDQVFTSYGVTEAAGNTVDARRARYAGFIGGTISPDEVKGRVQLAVAAANEDEITKSTLRELYPSITDKDIVSYFLNPKETLPKLQTKVQAAQVGAAAVRQGLVTNVATAEELVAMGITEAEAEKAYSAYAGMKPTLDLLSGLEKDQELTVNQQVAEGALLKGLASEQRKLEYLRQKELGRFSGSSGTARGVSLGSQLGGLV